MLRFVGVETFQPRFVEQLLHAHEQGGGKSNKVVHQPVCNQCNEL